MIEITVNGEPRSVQADISITKLLEVLQIRGDAVAVELNREVIPRDRHSDTQLTANDQLEVVTFVGGG